MRSRGGGYPPVARPPGRALSVSGGDHAAGGGSKGREGKEAVKVGALTEAVEKVMRLQRLDAQVRKLREEAEEKPRLLAEEKRAVEAARARLAEAEHAVKDCHKAADRKELDVRSKEENILKLEGQLNTATSNKVYSELLLNIRSARADIEKMEEAILGIMDDTEVQEEAMERIRVEVRNAEEEYREAEKSVMAQVAVVEEKLGKKVAIRDLLASEIDPEVLAVYERVRGSRNGVGITTVEVDGEGTHFCRTCQMEVTVQDVSVAVAGNRLAQCRSCNRILFTGTEPPVPAEEQGG